jgi:trehalose/maltose transport system permease protein
VSGRPRDAAAAERRLGLALCAPAVLAMTAVTAYPMLYAVWLSLQRYDLRFPAERRFVGLGNYASVLASDVWWQALANTALVTVASVALELALGFALALVMHRSLFARGALRAAVLVPYAIVTVVAALAWRFAFDPATGFVNGLLGSERAWLAHRGTAFAVIVLTEVWKTTPFLSLLLLAGLTLVPEELLQAARVDGAGALQRFFRVTLPIVRPAVLVALLFRALDAFRIFDTIFIETRGAEDTESVSIVGYHALITRLNLGIGSAVSVLIFGCVLAIALLFVKGLGAAPTRGLGGAE